jgi:hypothetical protein
MEPVSASEFEGVFVAPPNPTATAAQYGIEIVALDDIGQPGSADAGQVSVAPSGPLATGRCGRASALAGGPPNGPAGSSSLRRKPARPCPPASPAGR